jgi:hypothetical protein
VSLKFFLVYIHDDSDFFSTLQIIGVFSRFGVFAFLTLKLETGYNFELTLFCSLVGSGVQPGIIVQINEWIILFLKLLTFALHLFEF